MASLRFTAKRALAKVGEARGGLRGDGGDDQDDRR
jgi:hypothetical protein